MVRATRCCDSSCDFVLCRWCARFTPSGIPTPTLFPTASPNPLPYEIVTCCIYADNGIRAVRQLRHHLALFDIILGSFWDLSRYVSHFHSSHATSPAPCDGHALLNDHAHRVPDWCFGSILIRCYDRFTVARPCIQAYVDGQAIRLGRSDVYSVAGGQNRRCKSFLCSIRVGPALGRCWCGLRKAFVAVALWYRTRHVICMCGDSE